MRCLVGAGKYSVDPLLPLNYSALVSMQALLVQSHYSAGNDVGRNNRQ